MRQCDVPALEPLTALLRLQLQLQQLQDPWLVHLLRLSMDLEKVGYTKHEHNAGLVGNLAQLVDVVPSRLLFRHVALDRDTANRMSRMAVDDVSQASDESVGSDAIIASSCRGSRG
ncbi:hypothetical protein EDB89DRAFT_2076141 [Lactarius sanguifluus]|nr:hypothetical protein EDB89DRAFT_2079138 [Lactarius sanguifluus]KAH9166143.1 hypothetical protein EDB89DRAFT_2076141 [Lactarius sanguifluus]